MFNCVLYVPSCDLNGVLFLIIFFFFFFEGGTLTISTSAILYK